jgi:hypothetical protein
MGATQGRTTILSKSVGALQQADEVITKPTIEHYVATVDAAVETIELQLETNPTTYFSSGTRPVIHEVIHYIRVS